MSNVSSVTGLILAGGKSRRFGSNKAAHLIGGDPMIGRVFRSVSSVCENVLISVGDEPLPLELAEEVRYVYDKIPNAGPLAGICAGFHASSSPWLLAVACDMPFITVDALRHLLTARSPSLQAVMAIESNGREHPLCACYHRDILPVVEAQLARGHRALRDLLEQLGRVQTVLLPDDALRNINAPDDLPTVR